MCSTINLYLALKLELSKLQNTRRMTFAELGLNNNLLKKVEELGWVIPTPIQEKAIPIARGGQDLIGIAQTGTGKTGAFLLPILQKIGYKGGVDPQVIIFAPTKELAMQIGEHFEELNVSKEIKSAVFVGGIGMKHQIDHIKDGVDVIIATPGRFMDIYRKGAINLRQVNTMVLDEADRLMDMGFMPQLRTILEVIPRKRQNMLFSATYPEKVEALSFEFLEFPQRIEIEAESTPAETITQTYYSVPNRRTKVALLEHLLDDEETFSRVIVFVNTKENADYLFSFASRKLSGGAVVIHSNKSQSNRSNSLSAFESGEKRVLVTTNVSSRGLDIDEVSHVINFDVPNVLEDYVHRIGRTGRAYKVGEAISFANKAERMYLVRYDKKIKLDLSQVYLPSNVKPIDTPKEEVIEIEREVDRMKRQEDPEYKGAFHEKKAKNARHLNRGGKKKRR